MALTAEQEMKIGRALVREVIRKRGVTFDDKIRDKLGDIARWNDLPLEDILEYVQERVHELVRWELASKSEDGN